MQLFFLRLDGVPRLSDLQLTFLGSDFLLSYSDFRCVQRLSTYLLINNLALPH